MQPVAHDVGGDGSVRVEEALPDASRPLWQYVVMTLVGLVVLVGGARLLVGAAVWWIWFRR